jgi:hypothetical protein
MSNFFPPKNLVIYEIIMKNMAEPDKPQHMVEKKKKKKKKTVFMLGF